MSGPAGARASDRAGTAGLFEVPNTLRLKAKPEEASEAGVDIISAVREARSKLGELRLAGGALQMRLLAHFASNAVEPSGSIEKYSVPMTMFSRLLYDKLRGSADTVLAAAAASNLEATSLATQGRDLPDALARCATQAKIIHEHLSANRTPEELEQEFVHAVQRLARREAQAAEAKTGT